MNMASGTRPVERRRSFVSHGADRCLRLDGRAAGVGLLRVASHGCELSPGRTMTWTYLGFWAAGGLAGLLAGTLILRARGVLALATFGALVVAWVGHAVGAKWQYRLEYMPVLTALWISPRELFEPGMRLP